MAAKKHGGLPKGWPSAPPVTYITKPSYTSSVDSITRDALHSIPKGQVILSQTIPAPCQLVRITPISTQTHPAYGQHGLFATRSLPPDSLIIVYLGLVHTSEDTDSTSDYDLNMDRELAIGVDAQNQGNEARFINDYRGVAEKPNAEFRDCWIRVGDKVERRIGVFVKKDAKKGIPKGLEILVSYGKGFWNERLSSASTQ